MKFAAILFFISLYLPVFAQIVELRGKIIDEYSEPVYFATIIIKGTTNGVMADEYGQYSIKCKYGDVVQVSFIGYQSEEWTVTGSQKDFVLREDNVLEWDGFKSISTDGFNIFPTFGSGKTGWGVAYIHRFMHMSCGEYGWKPINRLTNRTALSLTYARPDYKTNGLMYPEVKLSQGLVSVRKINLNVMLQMGAGYYWSIADNMTLKGGNAVLSANLSFFNKRIFKRFNFNVSSGYTWFIKQPHNNFLSIASIQIIPVTHSTMFGGNSSLGRRCKKIIDNNYLLNF